ncbi:MAG: hypothetical protein COA30_00940 [Sulfurimonas sp.]|nr:MAG: hypothetical protein COA30_00940 [Sulfurimonas sp.]
MMKKILILGGSHRDISLIKASQELGYVVITLGNISTYLGHKYSDKALMINFNDLDTIRQIIKDEKIDYLIPGSGEESYINTVKLANELNIGNFDSLEVAKLVHNKWKFKEFCLAHNISTPYGFYYDENISLENLEFPVVVKPTNLSGGRGIEIVDNQQELEISIKKSSKVSNEIFLEEFIDGELIAYSIIIQNQKIIYDFIAKDETYLNPYLITTAYPYEISHKVHKKLKNDIEKLSTLLKLVDGMFHLQVIIRDDTPYIIDVTRRIPGDFFPDLMELSDEVDYNIAVIQAYTTGIIDNNLLKKSEKQNFIIRHCVMPKQNGIYSNIFITDALKENVICKFNLIEQNSIIDNYLTTQISILFIKLNKKDDKILKNLNALIYPVIKVKESNGN